MPLKPVVSKDDVSNHMKIDIPEQAKYFLEKINQDIFDFQIASLALLDSLNGETLQTEDEKTAKRKICSLILDQKENLESLAFSVKYLVEKFDVCEKSDSDCHEAKRLLEGMKRIFFKLKITI